MSVTSPRAEARRAALLAAALAACTASPTPRDGGVGGDGAATALPNLTAVIRAPLLQERVFTAGSCDVLEGCALAGRRRLLRFDLSTPNWGPGDLVLGSPTVDGGARPGFAFGPCHGHYHFTAYADYRLLAMDGREVGRGHKQAFCLEDTVALSGSMAPLPDSERFTCERQGIHAGWTDVYLRGLDCQYVDVTDVPAGRYRLRAVINGERLLAETRYDDNSAEIEVQLDAPAQDGGADASADVVAADPGAVCAREEQGIHRDCGWQAEPEARRCAPGSNVTVGCDRACGEPLGRCAGDTMLRVCAGERACADGAELASNDDACAGDAGSNSCSRVTFVCPAGGSFRVLTAPYRAGSAYTCGVEVR